MKQEQEKRGFFRSTIWVIGRTVLWLIMLTLLIAIAYGGWEGFNEVRRSSESLEQRIELNQQRIDGVKTEVDGIIALNPSGTNREIEAVQENVTALEEELNTLMAQQATLASDLAQQGEILTALESQMMVLVQTDETTNQNVATLNDGLLALQSDLNDTNGAIDGLGAQIDGVQGDMNTLGQTLSADITTLGDDIRAEFANPQEEIDRVLYSLSLFRVWEMVARARLRLAENNPGLAEADIESALTAVNLLIEANPGPIANSLTPVRDRLELALAAVAEDPNLAVRDLESVWETLDELLSFLVLPQGLDIQVTPESPEEEETQGDG